LILDSRDTTQTRTASDWWITINLYVRLHRIKSPRTTARQIRSYGTKHGLIGPASPLQVCSVYRGLADSLTLSRRRIAAALRRDFSFFVGGVVINALGCSLCLHLYASVSLASSLTSGLT